MKKADLIIHTNYMYTMQGDGLGFLQGKSIVTDGSKIIEIDDRKILEERYQAEKEIDAGDKLVLPGFIDGHMHTGHGVIRGVAQDIDNWMMEGMAPFEAVRSREAKDAGSRLAIAEAILWGTTTIGDDGSDMEGAIQFIEKTGVRGNVSVRVRNALPKAYKQGELYIFDKEMGERTLGESIYDTTEFSTVFSDEQVDSLMKTVDFLHDQEVILTKPTLDDLFDDTYLKDAGIM